MAVCSTYEITEIIKSLRTKNTCGYDEISNRIIKLSAPFIISPPTYICNAVLSTGVFPDRLKYAIVKPIFKKGYKQEISNYRSISLLTSFSKIIENSFKPDSLLPLIRIVFYYVNWALGNITDSNNSSKWQVIKCGVPDGSILGPLYFLFYINDLPKVINKDNNMALFADDTSIIISHSNQTLI